MRKTLGETTAWCPELFEQGAIAIRSEDFLASDPAPLPDEVEFDRVEGMLWGLAVGDSLGVTSEGLRPVDRQEFFGEVRDYLPLRNTSRREGIPSDDTVICLRARPGVRRAAREMANRTRPIWTDVALLWDVAAQRPRGLTNEYVEAYRRGRLRVFAHRDAGLDGEPADPMVR